MTALRLMHLADVHLDTPFYGWSAEWRRRLREAGRTAFARGVDLALERRAHAVLVAGDFFDDDLLTFATEQFILGQAERLRAAGIRLFYATGNHDPGRADRRAHQLAWPDNVHVFRTKRPERVAVTVDGAVIGWITGAGHVGKRESENLAAGFPPAEPDAPHVALLHAQVVSARGAENHDRYAPATVDDLRAGGYDYWALGHVHTRQQVADNAWYPGNTQGRHFGETGPKGGLWVEVRKGRPVTPEFVPLAPLVWETAVVSCPPDAVTLDALTDALAAQVTAAGEPDSAESAARTDAERLLRVTLTGRTPLAGQLRNRDADDLAVLAEELQRRLDVSLVEIQLGRVTRPLDLDSLRTGPSIPAAALELIERARVDNRLLMELAPDPLAARVEPEGRADYLRELLEDLEAALAERLLPEDEE